MRFDFGRTHRDGFLMLDEYMSMMHIGACSSSARRPVENRHCI